jgi:L-threonylcarbamoyladenylate synthase
MPNDVTAYAHELYAQMRRADELNGDRILVAAVPDDDAWSAVRDRLHKAAAQPL